MARKSELDERLRKAPVKVCLYLFLGALAMRVLYLSQYSQSPFFWVPALDSLYHDLLARQIAGGESPEGAFFRAPLYYYLLGGIYRVFGHSFWAARMLQAGVGAASCVLLYLIGIRLFRPAVALGGAVLMALYGPLVFFDGELLSPVAEVFLDLLFLLLAIRAMERESGRAWLAAGLALGVAVLARPNALVALPLALGWLFLRRPAARAGRPAALWGSAALLAAGALLPSALVTLRNYRVSGDPVFIASQGGINLFLGNRPEADGFTPSTPTRYAFQGEYEDSVALYGQRAAEEAVGRPLTASEAQRYWVGRVLAWWREDPAAALRLTWKKWVLAWTHREIRNNHAFDFIRKEFAPLLWLCPAGFWFAGPFGLLGIFLAWRDHPRSRFLALFVLLYVAGFVLFFVADRYRLPVVPALLLFGAYAVSRVWEQRARPRRAAAALAALAALGLFVGVDWYPTTSPAVRALDEWSAGNRYRDLGRLPEAEARYRRAAALDPSNPDVFTNLGVVQYASGQTEEAAASIRRALALRPGDAGNHYNLGRVEAALGRTGAAARSYREALRLRPDLQQAREGLLDLGTGAGPPTP